MANKVEMWVARNRNGFLYAFKQYPIRSLYWSGCWNTKDYRVMRLLKEMLPDLKWEDEPRLVEIKIKYKKDDGKE